MIEIVAKLLELKVSDVRLALNQKGRLFKLNFLERAGYSTPEEFDRYACMTDAFCWQDFLYTRITKQKFTNETLCKTPAPTLKWENFSYLPQIRGSLLPLMKKAKEEGQKGINILLYGPAGTGKTELSRLITRELGCTGFTIKSLLDSKISQEDWNMATKLMEKQKNLLLHMDEAEDFFNQGVDMFSAKRLDKTFLTSALEENPIPTIWTANNIRELDPAILRRFRYILKVENPPFAYMKSLISEKLGNYLSGSEIDELAVHKNVSPAIIQIAAENTENIRNSGAEVKSEFIFEIINNVLQAQGFQPLIKKVHSSSASYDPKFTNSETDLEELCSGLQKAGRGRLCLYGPPGTGKTAFGHWVAQKLNRPLLIRKASDLLSCYVGQTEHAIADAFEAARRSNAVLLIDEADSFLYNRTGERQTWEITAVNEFLTQMEACDGYFIATTNMLDLIYTAALRRFDLKNKFDYLKPEQSRELFKKYAEQRKLPLTEENLKEAEQFTKIAPGDFAAVNRRMDFTKNVTAEAFLEALRKEEEIKENPSGKASIGFF